MRRASGSICYERCVEPQSKKSSIYPAYERIYRYGAATIPYGRADDDVMTLEIVSVDDEGRNMDDEWIG